MILAVLATPPTGVHLLHTAVCPLFPWGTVRWSRGCRNAGPGTRSDVRSRAGISPTAMSDENRLRIGRLVCPIS